jgi:hypothetical protein
MLHGCALLMLHAGLGRHKHLTLCLPFKQLQCLARFHGATWRSILAVRNTLAFLAIAGYASCALWMESGRFYVPDLGPHVEDLLHCMLARPAYDNIISVFFIMFRVAHGVAGQGYTGPHLGHRDSRLDPPKPV